MIAQLLSLCFPPFCIGCGKDDTPLCKRCISLARKTISNPSQNSISSFDFKDPLIKKSIHALKYYHRRDLIPPLSAQLAHDLTSAVADIGSYTIVPIPMSKIRKLLRGYNQAENIAMELGKALNLPVEKDLLVRKGIPARQTMAKTRKERMLRQKGSFAVSRKPTSDHVILIDDVTTTGATLREAREVLEKSGVSSIIAATLAH